MMSSNHRTAVSEEKSSWSWRSFRAQLEARRKTVMTVTLLVGAIPAVFAALWVHRYGVEIPWKDDWDAAPLIVAAHTGHLTWSDLFAQQQEARYILPKLILIASTAGGRWDVRDQMWLAVVVAGLTALGLYWLLGKTGLSAVTRAFCFWLMTVLIFSAAQFELWPWASGFPLFLPAFFLVAALCVLETQLSTGAKCARATSTPAGSTGSLRTTPSPRRSTAMSR